jgi:hypothetical protein
VTSITMPAVAAAQVGTWSLARVLYHLGYATGDPAKVCLVPYAHSSDADILPQRNTRGGLLGSLTLMSLLGTSSYSAFKLVQAARR